MRNYLNPLYERSCPDPFVLKHRGQYWCYCTGFSQDGRCFGVLHSTDLVHWRELSGAMAPLEEEHREYWAPEVACWNGRFYMYYSCGDGVRMQIRVAAARDPQGPFVDCGRRLTAQDFAIDAHVFEDDDGSRYLFYATDFLEHSRIGTGTVVDRMLDPFTLAGDPRPVSRARYDWQIFDPKRAEKGGVCWHTIEGPFVIKHKGRYYQMFSGGNWKDATYGVSYAAAASIACADEWEQTEHNERNPLVLRTIRGAVTGPGHNSVVLGPDNLQLFCVYHRWAPGGEGRLLAIDRLEIIGERIAVLGPSTESQRAPNPPAFAGFGYPGGEAGVEPGWTAEQGYWKFDPETAQQGATTGRGRALFSVPFDAFVAEVSLRAAQPSSAAGRLGAGLYASDGALLSFSFDDSGKTGRLCWTAATGPNKSELALPPDFDPFAWHLLRLEVDGKLVRLLMDGFHCWRGMLSAQPAGLELNTLDRSAAFSGFAVTGGWRDLFTEAELGLADLGWRVVDGEWEIRDAELRCRGHATGALVVKERAFDAYEAVVNARLLEGTRGCVGFAPFLDSDNCGPLLTLELDGTPRLVMRHISGGVAAPDLERLPLDGTFELPGCYDPQHVRQFRFLKERDILVVQVETQTVGKIAVSSASGRIGLFACRVDAAFEAVRLSALPVPGSTENSGVVTGA
jgi:GH43 family beta-xylosidase